MKPKGVRLTGTLQIGQGKKHELFVTTVIAPYGNTNSLDLHIGSAGSNIGLKLDRASAIALAKRILDELDGLGD